MLFTKLKFKVLHACNHLGLKCSPKVSWFCGVALVESWECYTGPWTDPLVNSQLKVLLACEAWSEKSVYWGREVKG